MNEQAYPSHAAAVADNFGYHPDVIDPNSPRQLQVNQCLALFAELEAADNNFDRRISALHDSLEVQ
jgi:hypothetical protein